MYLELDGKGPRYAQITRALRGALLDGRLGIGGRIPPSRTLARELGVSRNTVVSAYEQLRAEGYLEGRVGAGSYVVATAAPRRRAAKPPEGPLAPSSRYVRRARREAERRAAAPRVMDQGLRYNLQYGTPYANPALTTGWARALARAARRTSPDYPMIRGLPALRTQVADYLARRRGVQASPDDVLIVNGTQQALALTARVLLEEGDVAVLEDPHYFGARQVLNAHGARIVGVPVDDDGLVCAKLPATAPKLVFVTPSHQFPSGTVLSLPRRFELLSYALAQKCYVAEDDYDSEFRYDVRPIAALRALDAHDRVIYIGTFSKALFPALRLGYMVLPAALREDFIAAKWLADFGCSAIEQAALAEFIGDGSFERHLRHAARTLGERRQTLLDALARHAGARIAVRGANAGMHLVAWLPGLSIAQTTQLVARCRERGLGVYALAPHYLDASAAQAALLLGYAGIAKAEIEPAIRLLGQCLAEFR